MSLLALQDLFRRYREKATGVWKLGVDPGRTIYFDYGDAVFAQSTHVQDRLTYILVERGKVTQAQMDYALANLKPGLSIGKNLIEMGFITQRDLLEVAKAQVERIICGGLGTADQEPTFEAKDLDANVVRLPLSTPQVFLTGILGLQDREGLLELLGPLNQVVILQGRNLQDLSLPPDLAKLPPLLDGTHTILELSRESMAEPVRLGSFALYLREMGWARLHEMPPLDRHALDLALTPEREPLSAPLAEPFPETVPSLFATIEEAARPTTNLEHLSQALDADPVAAPAYLEDLEVPAHLDELYLPEVVNAPLEELPDPEPAPWEGRAESGQAMLPTPAVELPVLPEPSEEPRVVLQVPLDLPAPEAFPPVAEPAPSRQPKILGAALAVICLIGGGVYLARRKPKPAKAVPVAAGPVVPASSAPVRSMAVPPPAEPPKPVAEPPAPEPEPKPAAPTEAKPEPKAKAESKTKPEPKVEPKGKPEPKAKPEPARPQVGTSVAERLNALAKGDLDKALKQGAARAKELPSSSWTLRLEIACQGDTIRRVAELFKGQEPDLFLLPMTLRDGRACYQVLYGHFPTRDAAEKQVKRLPAAFLADRNRPKPFRIDEIPKLQ